MYERGLEWLELLLKIDQLLFCPKRFLRPLTIRKDVKKLDIIIPEKAGKEKVFTPTQNRELLLIKVCKWFGTYVKRCLYLQ